MFADRIAPAFPHQKRKQEPAAMEKGYVRRIVTGHDAEGNAIFTEDQAAPSVHTNPRRVGYYLTNLWITDQTPAYVGNDPDPTSRPLTRSLKRPSCGNRRSPMSSSAMTFGYLNRMRGLKEKFLQRIGWSSLRSRA